MVVRPITPGVAGSVVYNDFNEEDPITMNRRSNFIWDLSEIKPVIALSVRKLNPSYTNNCLLLWRTLNNTTSNIGFAANGLVNTDAAASFLAGTSALVRTWYDQSGNGNHLANPSWALTNHLSWLPPESQFITVYSTPQIITQGRANIVASATTANLFSGGGEIFVAYTRAFANSYGSNGFFTKGNVAHQINKSTSPHSHQFTQIGSTANGVWRAGTGTMSGNWVRIFNMSYNSDSVNNSPVFYDNGIKQNTVTTNALVGTASFDHTSNITIGFSDASLFEVLMYDRILSDYERIQILQNMNKFYYAYWNPGPDQSLIG